MRRTLTVALVLSILSASTLLAQRPPKRVKSEYLKSYTGVFLKEQNGQGLYYSMTFKVRKEISSPIYVSVSIENPSNKKAPFIVELTLEPGQKELPIRSPAFTRIKNGKLYRVEILLFKDSARKEMIGKHVQKILFSVPPGMEYALGVEFI